MAQSTMAQHIENDANNELNPQLYNIQPIPGKGRGLVAHCDIAKGIRILLEKPLFTTANISPVSRMESIIVEKLKALSKPEQRQFLSLHNNHPKNYPFSGIIKTNSLPCGPGSVIGGIYPTICLINNSCLPNAHHSWNSNLDSETIYALTDIKSGEEITIRYGEGASGPRRAKFQDAFGFNCTCSLCSLPPSELQASDARFSQIDLLDEAIGDPNRVVSKPGDCLADCFKLLQLFEEEYKDAANPMLARLYYDAFQIAITHGDQARAGVFAERAYRARLECEGEDSPTTQKVKALMENPAGHRNFEATKIWKTKKQFVPKGLTGHEFEKWLWRLRR